MEAEAQTLNNGPRDSLSLSLEQASTILQIHNFPHPCTKLDCIARGFNNKTYFATPVSGLQLVIRVTGKCPAWEKLKTENEVAAIQYLKAHTNIPVPKIYGFSSNPETSPVGLEYIFMEKLNGIPLDELFRKLELTDKKKMLVNVVEIFGKLRSLKFKEIGSFGFGKDGKVVIGPGLEAEAGPFPNYWEYLKQCLKTELKYLRDTPFLMEGDGQRLAIEITGFIPKLETIMDPQVLENVAIVFTHGDFEHRNILVDEETLEVIGFLDFEFSGAFPEDEDWFSGFEWIREEYAELYPFVLEQCKLYGVQTPKEIAGHAMREKLYKFKGNIAPWWLRKNIPEGQSPPQSWIEDRESSRIELKQFISSFNK